MHVGTNAIFQGVNGNLTDREVYRAELHLARLAEPLGFDSIWAVEHHFKDFCMCPDVVEFLSYMAGCTSTIRLGTGICVLPWHDPLRLAEQILMLDNLSDGRVIFGIGRGTGKREFDAFGVNMEESRQRFKESAEAIIAALETGVMEYDGIHIKQPRTELFPRPFKSFKDRTYSATISPESAEIMAKIGTGVFVITQKPWSQVADECVAYRKMYTDAIGTEAPPPFCSAWTFVDKSHDRAEELAHRFLGNYWKSIIDFYEFDQPHLKEIPGYEMHAKMYDRLIKPGGLQKMTDFYVDLQTWGTPEEVIEKVVSFSDLTGSDGFLSCFRYGGMPEEEAERNMRLFATDVMPALKALPPARERELAVTFGLVQPSIPA
jgi:alkanesulfonate monooxygenase SsuD/methylene tetrahydromethanopterin reductase-like flavin-dependent oxidoreductase (luciferase family)